jgi:hypothetical protein
MSTLLETGIIRTRMICTDTGRKFSLKMTNGGIIKEKSYSTNVFLWEMLLILQ